jgi:5-methylcytosine-specific restriction endonuclease McrA
MPRKKKTEILTIAPKKANIPRALREQVWIQNAGKHFEHKCLVEWCQNIMNVFDFHVGHNIPESKGGATNIKNLKPICARCNLSMGSQYSIIEWTKMGQKTVPVGQLPIKKPWWLWC